MTNIENGDTRGRIDYPIAGQYDSEPDVLAIQNQNADKRILAALGKVAGEPSEQTSAGTETAA